MVKRQRIVIGTRGSALALKQAEIVQNALDKANCPYPIELVVITTEGDANHNPIPLDTMGKGWFTKEIEVALLGAEIDIAVHSLKDLPEELPDGLELQAYLDREDSRDVLVSNSGVPLSELPPGAVIGTDSIRRKVQVLALRPDVIVESIRGNVPTRLEKLESGTYDAVVLAAAGLKRLGLGARVTQYFTPEEIMPAPGQGILAIETRERDEELNTLMRAINDRDAAAAACAERSFSAAVGGGCKSPIGAHTRFIEGTLHLRGMYATESGTIWRGEVTGTCEEAVALGQELAAAAMAYEPR